MKFELLLGENGKIYTKIGEEEYLEIAESNFFNSISEERRLNLVLSTLREFYHPTTHLVQ